MNRSLRTAGLTLALVVPSPDARAEDSPIEDNSFVVEEAYNQEPGVVQHVQVMQLDLTSHDWTYTFTDEWPASDQDDQVSVSVPVHHVDDATGLGDVMLNYRRELFRHAEDRLVVTPRVSLSLPSGNAERELGEGTTGLQVQACISVRALAALVLHSNVGVTTPLSATTEHASSITLAQSVVWLAHPRLNLLVEALWSRTDAGDVISESLLVSPGVRAAFNLGSTQVVPGLAVPIGVGASSRERYVFLYLSVEHPF